MSPRDLLTINEDLQWECQICQITGFDSEDMKSHVDSKHDLTPDKQQTLAEVKASK